MSQGHISISDEGVLEIPENKEGSKVKVAKKLTPLSSVIKEYLWVFKDLEETIFVKMHTFLIEKGYKKIVKNDNFMFAPGTLPVLIIAHADTVHENKWSKDREGNVDVFHDEAEGVLWSPQGVGGDDRCGVLAIHKLLSVGFRPWVLITSGEERGCIGAKAFCEDYSNYMASKSKTAEEKKTFNMDHLKYIVQVDREGSKHGVFYSCDGKNKLWHEYLEGIGFKKETGSTSDIRHIMELTEICGVNLAAGYYGQHTKSEFIDYWDLWFTIKKLSGMFKALNTSPQFKWKPDHKPAVPYTSYRYRPPAGYKAPHQSGCICNLCIYDRRVAAEAIEVAKATPLPGPVGIARTEPIVIAGKGNGVQTTDEKKSYLSSNLSGGTGQGYFNSNRKCSFCDRTEANSRVVLKPLPNNKFILICAFCLDKFKGTGGYGAYGELA